MAAASTATANKSYVCHYNSKNISLTDIASMKDYRNGIGFHVYESRCRLFRGSPEAPPPKGRPLLGFTYCLIYFNDEVSDIYRSIQFVQRLDISLSQIKKSSWDIGKYFPIFTQPVPSGLVFWTFTKCLPQPGITFRWLKHIIRMIDTGLYTNGSRRLACSLQVPAGIAAWC